MRLAAPHALWLLALLPVLWLAWRGPPGAGVGFSLAGPVRRLPRGFAAAALAALPWLRLAAVALAILALARPQYGVEQTRVFRDGIAIAMVVDVSTSMSAVDLADDPTRSRLDVVKTTFRDFVEGRRDEQGQTVDVIGMVSFARLPTVLTPLTSDHDALLALLDQLTLVDLADEDGTAIGDAIATALDVLGTVTEGSRVMILLTDGADNAGETFPSVAAEAARALGVRVYTVGAGARDGGALSPGTPGVPGLAGPLRRAPPSLDEGGLAGIADVTGGRYFRAADAEALASIYGEIDRLEKASYAVERYQRYLEGFPLLALLAALLLALEQALRATRLRVVTA